MLVFSQTDVSGNGSKETETEQIREKHSMKNGLLFFITLIIFSSCSNYIRVNKHLETNTNKYKVKTTVDNYSSTKKEFYGTITICNQTADTLTFNFNQTLLIDNAVLKADYNIKPISYACQAFDINPKDCSTWDVRWKTEKDISNFENVELKADTTILLSTCRRTFIH